jgi:hypothetical protein
LISTYLSQEVWSLHQQVVGSVKVLLGGGFQSFQWEVSGVWNKHIDLAKFSDRSIDKAIKVGQL